MVDPKKIYIYINNNILFQSISKKKMDVGVSVCLLALNKHQDRLTDNHENWYIY